jgi:succinyl-diaminopimelate desuccinylase
MKPDLDAEIEGRRDELFALCAKLVAQKSPSPPGDTTGVGAVVREFLNAEGFAPEIVAETPAAPNVVASVVGSKPGPHLIYNAHMDTMQAGDEERWTAPIYEVTRRDGRLYGLGMGNMKGALAGMCLALAVLRRRAADIAGKVTLTAVCDEVMFGERGTAFLLRARPDLKGDFLLSGEGPGFMDLAPAEKGLLWLDVEASGDIGHSSRALKGRTAAAKLAALLLELDAVNDERPAPPAELDGISGGEDGNGLRVSLSAGTLSGGGVRSLIAPRAKAEIDVRLPPGVSTRDIEERVRAAVDGDGTAVTRVKGWDSNWTPLEHPLTLAVASAAEAVRGKKPRMVVRLPGSDARRWRELGVPAVCYGPQPTLSAGVDDYAEERDVVDCAKVYARTALALLSR